MFVVIVLSSANGHSILSSVISPFLCETKYVLIKQSTSLFIVLGLIPFHLENLPICNNSFVTCSRLTIIEG